MLDRRLAGISPVADKVHRAATLSRVAAAIEWVAIAASFSLAVATSIGSEVPPRLILSCCVGTLALWAVSNQLHAISARLCRSAIEDSLATLRGQAIVRFWEKSRD